MTNHIPKSEAIRLALKERFDIYFNPQNGKCQWKYLGEENYKDVDREVFEAFRNFLEDGGLSVTRAEIRRAVNASLFDKAKELGQYEEIEMLLSGIMESRFNMIKQQPEVMIFDLSEEFVPLSKYILNSLNRLIRSKGLKTSRDALNEILFSDFSTNCNPIKEYFTRSKIIYDINIDYIELIANTVKVNNSDKWYEYLKKWLVAVVANVMVDENCKNHTMLVLTGEQGAYKTTWLDNLCPIALKKYLYTGKIDPSNKDTQTLLAEFFLINVDDQLKQLNKKDENDLKNMITAPNVKYRRPYDVFIQEYPHYCSFMASVNGSEFLTDPTGSRRFLAFEVLEINIELAKKQDIDALWQQAYNLFKDGFRYWFTQEEIISLNEENVNFQVISIEEQLLIRYFERPKYRDLATHHLQPAEILAHLQSVTNVRIRQKALGEALLKNGFEKWRKTEDTIQKMVYSVIKFNFSQIEEQQTAK